MQHKKYYLGMLSALLLASSATVSAQVYVGGGLGVVKAKSGCNFEGLCSNSEATFKLIGGYSIAKNFAIELNYLDLGSQDFSSSMYQENSNYHVKSSAMSLAGLMSHPFTDNFGGFAKLGLAHIKSKNQYSVNRSGPDALNYAGQTTYKDPHIQLGIGLTYKISDQLSLRAEYEQFRLKSHFRRNAFETVTVGAQFAF